MSIIACLEACILAVLAICYANLKREVERNIKIACDYADAIKTIIDNRIYLAEKRVDELEKGIVPDYDKAREAAQNLNAFNDTINMIWNYDPYKAIRMEKDGEND